MKKIVFGIAILLIAAVAGFAGNANNNKAYSYIIYHRYECGLEHGQTSESRVSKTPHDNVVKNDKGKCPECEKDKRACNNAWGTDREYYDKYCTPKN